MITRNELISEIISFGVGEELARNTADKLVEAGFTGNEKQVKALLAASYLSIATSADASLRIKIAGDSIVKSMLANDALIKAQKLSLDDLSKKIEGLHGDAAKIQAAILARAESAEREVTTASRKSSLFSAILAGAGATIFSVFLTKAYLGENLKVLVRPADIPFYAELSQKLSVIEREVRKNDK